jgi:hypothetical protein
LVARIDLGSISSRYNHRIGSYKAGNWGHVQFVQVTTTGSYNRGRVVGIQALAIFFYSQWEENMTGACDLFNNLIDKDPGIHVELSDDAKYAVMVEGKNCSSLSQVVGWNPRMCYMYQDYVDRPE